MPDFGFQGEGVRVAAVAPGSPAAAVGIQAGDVIVAVDGQPVRNLQEYTGLLYRHQPGDRMAVVVLRDGARISVEATLASR